MLVITLLTVLAIYTVTAYIFQFKVTTDISDDNSCKTKLHFVM